jgi:hypothetical protein
MTVVLDVTHETKLPTPHQDIEFEIGALSSRHGISAHHARQIIEDCGDDWDCIDEKAKQWKMRQ